MKTQWQAHRTPLVKSTSLADARDPEIIVDCEASEHSVYDILLLENVYDLEPIKVNIPDGSHAISMQCGTFLTKLRKEIGFLSCLLQLISYITFIVISENECV